MSDNDVSNNMLTYYDMLIISSNIAGCPKGTWGKTCTETCPSKCIDKHCRPENGSCFIESKYVSNRCVPSINRKSVIVIGGHLIPCVFYTLSQYRIIYHFLSQYCFKYHLINTTYMFCVNLFFFFLSLICT